MVDYLPDAYLHLINRWCHHPKSSIKGNTWLPWTWTYILNFPQDLNYSVKFPEAYETINKFKPKFKITLWRYHRPYPFLCTETIVRSEFSKSLHSVHITTEKRRLRKYDISSVKSIFKSSGFCCRKPYENVSVFKPENVLVSTGFYTMQWNWKWTHLFKLRYYSMPISIFPFRRQETWPFKQYWAVHESISDQDGYWFGYRLLF